MEKNKKNTPGEWKVGTIPLYVVYRQKDTSKPDERKNRDYMGAYFNYEGDAEAIAKRLNEEGAL